MTAPISNEPTTTRLHHYAGHYWIAVPTWRCILNYLAKAYLRDGGSGSAVNWSVSAESWVIGQNVLVL